jgi:small subunit ribosomal protein S17
VAEENNEEIEEGTEVTSEDVTAGSEAPAAEETPAEAPAAAAEPEAPAAAGAPAEAPAAEAEVEAPAPPAEAPRVRGPRPKPARKPVAAKERGTYTREPKPEHEEGRRKERRGVVMSDKGDKTITVRIDSAKPHPKYLKIVRRSTKIHVHDEKNQAKVGDVVRVVETRPLSKLKRWRLVEIVEAAK